MSDKKSNTNGQAVAVTCRPDRLISFLECVSEVVEKIREVGTSESVVLYVRPGDTKRPLSVVVRGNVDLIDDTASAEVCS